MISARMRTEAGQVQVSIRNLSSKGMCVSAPHAPARGSYVEISCAGQTILGQVRWSSGTQFGLRTRDPVDAASLLGGRSGQAAPGWQPSALPPQKDAGAHGGVLRADQGRRLSRLLQFAIVAFAGAMLAVALATVVYDDLHHAFARILALR